MKPRHISTAILLVVASTASAQTLSGEVTVERTITPVERPATRLGSVSPTISTPQLKLHPLKAASYNGTGALSRSLTRLEPAAYADTFAVDPWLGYVSAGYFPTQSFGIEAGFDLIATRTTRLGSFLNFGGTQFDVKHDLIPDPIECTVGHQEYTIGAKLSTFIGEGRRVDGDFAYTLSNMKMPVDHRTIEGGANHARLSLGYSSSKGALPWYASFAYGYFGFRHDTPVDIIFANKVDDAGKIITDVTPASESLFNIDGGISWKQDNHSWELGVGVDVQHLNQLSRVWPISVPGYALDGTEDFWEGEPTFWDEGSKTLAVITLNPSYNLARKKYILRLGARVQYTTGPRGNKFRISPDVKFAWTPSGRFALDVTLNGGEQINSLAALNAHSPWLIPAFSYERSNLPFAIDASASIVPMTGFTIRPFVGFAVANSWLMPSVVGNNKMPQFNYQDVHGAHYGIELSYKHKLFGISASIEGASSADDDAETAYYLWDDRASWQALVSLETRPIKPLTVGLSYRYRGERKVYETEANAFGQMAWFESNAIHDLGDISNLSFNASWQFGERLSVFANLDNLLCKRYQMIYGVPSARLGGLVGLSFKF